MHEVFCEWMRAVIEGLADDLGTEQTQQALRVFCFGMPEDWDDDAN